MEQQQVDWDHVARSASVGLRRRRPQWVEHEEVIQDVWVAVHAVQAQTDSTDIPYLAQAVRYKVIDAWRDRSPLSRSEVRDNRAAREADQPIPFLAFSFEALTANLPDRISFDPGHIDDGFEQVERRLDSERLWATVMPLLSTRERLIVTMLLVHGMPMHQIGEMLAVSESRVSQILAAAIKRVQLRLGLPQREFILRAAS